MGLAGGMMDQKLFSIVIWALLWATVIAPLAFTRVLEQFIQQNSSDLSSAPTAGHCHDVEHGAGRAGVQLESVEIDFSGAQSHEVVPVEGSQVVPVEGSQ